MVVNSATESATMELVRQRIGADPIVRLRELYVDDRHSDREIAAAFGVNRVTVTNWRLKNGISPKDRKPVDVATAVTL